MTCNGKHKDWLCWVEISLYCCSYTVSMSLLQCINKTQFSYFCSAFSFDTLFFCSQEFLQGTLPNMVSKGMIVVARLHQAGMNHKLSTYFNGLPLWGFLLNMFTLINTHNWCWLNVGWCGTCVYFCHQRDKQTHICENWAGIWWTRVTGLSMDRCFCEFKPTSAKRGCKALITLHALIAVWLWDLYIYLLMNLTVHFYHNTLLLEVNLYMPSRQHERRKM